MSLFKVHSYAMTDTSNSTYNLVAKLMITISILSLDNNQ